MSDNPLGQNEPHLLIISDRPHLLGELEADARAAGFAAITHSAFASCEDADGPMSQMHKWRLVLLDIPGDDLELKRWLQAIDTACSNSATPLLVLTIMPMLDQIWSALERSDTEFVIGHSRAERLIAMSHHAGDASPYLREDYPDKASEIRSISEKIAALARRLGELGDEDDSGPSSLGDPAHAFAAQAEPLQPLGEASRGWPGNASQQAVLVRRIIALRRMRMRYFNASLFADPAWDMLLDLFAARLEGKPISVSSLCIASGVPSTTALRWIRQMSDEKLFERRADERDKRRIHIRLSDQAEAQMHKLCQAMARGGMLPV